MEAIRSPSIQLFRPVFLIYHQLGRFLAMRVFIVKSKVKEIDKKSFITSFRASTWGGGEQKYQNAFSFCFLEVQSQTSFGSVS